MHLANAVHVPVIALMRQKNPEWAPIDEANSVVITVKNRDDWVDKITVDDVVAVLTKANFPKAEPVMSSNSDGKHTFNSL
jgi:ADP-heptose:LPS heptosyltransferase